MASAVPAPVPVIFILLALALSGEAARRGTGEDKKPTTSDVIRFHFGGNFPPYDFIENEPQPQTRKGFSILLTEKLCKRNNLNCEFIKHSYDDCWTTSEEGSPGRAILDGSLDVCSTYTHTFTRQLSVDFTHAYTRRTAAGILVRLDKSGKPVVHPRDNNLRGRRIGVVGGWATDRDSLDYIINGCTKEKFSNFNVVAPDDKSSGPDAAFRELLEGNIDLLYVLSSTIDDRKKCKQSSCDQELYTHLGEKYAWLHTGILDYQVNGTTLAFAMKGDPIIPYLNPMIDDFLRTKEYAELCKEFDGEDIACFRNEFSEGPERTGRGSQTDLARTQNCDQEPDPEACNACSSGYCGCDV